MGTATDTDLSGVDLADPAVWDAGPPYELFEAMQRDARAHFSPQSNMPMRVAFGRSPATRTCER